MMIEDGEDWAGRKKKQERIREKQAERHVALSICQIVIQVLQNELGLLLHPN